MKTNSSVLATLLVLAVAVELVAQQRATNSTGTMQNPFDALDAPRPNYARVVQFVPKLGATNLGATPTNATKFTPPPPESLDGASNLTTVPTNAFGFEPLPVLEPREIARRILPSTVLLVMQDARFQALSLGSGFIVGEGKIISNEHVVEGASAGFAKIVGKEGKFQIKGILAKNEDLDLVLLSVPGIAGNVATVASSRTLQIGDPVYACGNPKGLEGTFSAGILSSFRQVGTNRLLQITSPVSPGSSGGPIANSYGDIVGVTVATYQGAQNLNLAIPGEFVRVLLEAHQELQELPQAAKTKSAKNLFSILGSESDTSGVIGESFMWDGDISGSLSGYGQFSFALRNRSEQTVKNIKGLAIIYDRNGNPADFSRIDYYGAIPPGLARRLRGTFDSSVKPLTTPISPQNQYEYSLTPSTKVEFRILSFEIEE
jgi:S1-C subfamily serine protease